MFEELKKNLERESSILREMRALQAQLDVSDEATKGVFSESFAAYIEQLKMLNDAVPALLAQENVDLGPATAGAASGAAGAVSAAAKKETVQFSYVSPATKEKKIVTISRADKSKFLRELSLSEVGLKGLKKISEQKEQVVKPSRLAGMANRWFSRISEKMVPAFSGVGEDLKKANIRYRLGTYLAIALFVSLWVFAGSIVFFGVIIGLGLVPMTWALGPLILLALSLVGFYIYPSLEKGSVERKISDELPFATIHMAAIAGSNIEPSKIFKIIASGSEYPNVGFELKKMLNQVDIFGYDLVTALKNAAQKSSNERLAELFQGLATNIVSGGDLKSYLEKKSENLLLDYKLERQRYTALAETFMDIYISVLITAPLVMMMLFVIMNLTGLGGGMSLNSILTLIIGGISLANIIFLIVLQLKQPKA